MSLVPALEDMAFKEPAPSLPGRTSWLMEQLPAIYRGNDFLRRFLVLLEDMWDPVEQRLETLHYYLDPSVAPPEFLSWLATWVDLVMDENWPEDRRRKLVRSAAELYRWRGTRRGLVEYIRLYANVEPQITEFFGGLSLGAGNRLGVDAFLGQGGDHTFAVTVEVDDSAAVDIATLKRIIEAEKPGHTAYSLEIVAPGPRSASPRG